MGSWITCPCGAHIHTNLFAGTGVSRLIKDSDYDAIDDPVDRAKLEDLFFRSGIPVYRCGKCGRLAVEWDQASGVAFYSPAEPAQGPSCTSPASRLAEELEDQLMAYFGDQEDEAAMAQLREDIKGCSETARILRDGIVEFLSNPDLDCVQLVQGCANRNVHDSRREANVWLLNLFTQLFAPSGADMKRGK
jgi:hypothetical protein